VCDSDGDISSRKADPQPARNLPKHADHSPQSSIYARNIAGSSDLQYSTV
jgi:hypothetical protein